MTGLFLFTNDLRLQDNLALAHASEQCQQLLLLYVEDPIWQQPLRFDCAELGGFRREFIHQSLGCLQSEAKKLGQTVHCVNGPFAEVIAQVVEQYDIQVVYYSAPSDQDMQNRLAHAKSKSPQADWQGIWQHTLFARDQVPMLPQHLPPTFSQFRRMVELSKIAINRPRYLNHLPPPVTTDNLGFEELPVADQQPQDGQFVGGSVAALAHVLHYFDSANAQSYKETRNELDDWASSTKFSPYLAMGCISARQIFAHLREHEMRQGCNDSTRFILFELLWREYFHFSALKIKAQLFSFQGNAAKPPKTHYDWKTFASWTSAATGFPLVDAAMRQLNTTGYISNRARQIVASCLINELGQDWRYGCAYFQQQLIDYDPAINWGNWQYIAGVGADPRGGRHFNIDKQQAQYDPDGVFIRRWGGEALKLS